MLKQKNRTFETPKENLGSNASISAADKQDNSDLHLEEKGIEYLLKAIPRPPDVNDSPTWAKFLSEVYGSGEMPAFDESPCNSGVITPNIPTPKIPNVEKSCLKVMTPVAKGSYPVSPSRNVSSMNKKSFETIASPAIISSKKTPRNSPRKKLRYRASKFEPLSFETPEKLLCKIKSTNSSSDKRKTRSNRRNLSKFRQSLSLKTQLNLGDELEKEDHHFNSPVMKVKSDVSGSMSTPNTHQNCFDDNYNERSSVLRKKSPSMAKFVHAHTADADTLSALVGKLDISSPFITTKKNSGNNKKTSLFQFASPTISTPAKRMYMSKSSASSNSLLNTPGQWYRAKNLRSRNISGSSSSNTTTTHNLLGSSVAESYSGDRFIAVGGSNSITTSAETLTGVRSSASSARKHSSLSNNATITNSFQELLKAEAVNISEAELSLANQMSQHNLGSSERSYQAEVARACGVSLDQRILSFNGNSSSSTNDCSNHGAKSLSSRYNRPLNRSSAIESDKSSGSIRSSGTHAKRKIPKVPERILDAPGITDDYYCNLLDWSSRNIVAVALGDAIYIWNASNGETTELFTVPSKSSQPSIENLACSVSWSADGSHLAVGDLFGRTHLVNVEPKTRVRTLKALKPPNNSSTSFHRIGSLSWNRGVLSTGGSLGIIHNHDVRQARSLSSSLSGHDGDVCGLKWNNVSSGMSSDAAMLASGGNDNLVNVWDVRWCGAAKFTFDDHKGAVKALAWCPWQQGILATGGGLDDQQIKFWDTLSGGTCVGSTMASSQITALHFSTTYRELISAHGYSENQLTIWKYPSMNKVMELPQAHQSRVLYSCISPDGQSVCTGAADENIKFWRIWAFDPKMVKVKGGKKLDWKTGKIISNGRGQSGAGESTNASPDFGSESLR